MSKRRFSHGLLAVSVGAALWLFGPVPSSWAQAPTGQPTQQATGQLPTVQSLRQMPMPAMPSASAVQEASEAARRRLNVQRDDAARRAEIRAEQARAASSGQAMRPDVANQPGLPAQATMPRLTDLAQQTKSAPDPAKLAQQFGLPAQSGQQEDRDFRLVVFASLSMPEESLKRLGRDVRRVGGVIVLRGMKHGLQAGRWMESVQALKPLAETGAEIQINPKLFLRYGIRSVPTVLLAPEGVSEGDCDLKQQCSSGPIAMAAGDVSVGHVLEEFGDRRDSVGRLARELARHLP